jgi:hypothetical protein
MQVPTNPLSPLKSSKRTLSIVKLNFRVEYGSSFDFGSSFLTFAVSTLATSVDSLVSALSSETFE